MFDAGGKLTSTGTVSALSSTTSVTSGYGAQFVGNYTLTASSGSLSIAGTSSNAAAAPTASCLSRQPSRLLRPLPQAVR